MEAAAPKISSAVLSGGGTDENGTNIQALECQAGGVGLNLEDNQHTIAILFLYLNESSKDSSRSH